MGRLKLAVWSALLLVACRGGGGGTGALTAGEVADSALAWPLPDKGRVEVRNAAGVTGLARVASRTLRAQGFDVVTYGSHDAESDTTWVLIRSGSADAANAVRRALGQGIVRERRDTTRRVDVTVILGRDFHPAR